MKKRFFSLLLVLVLIAALAIPAMAADPTTTITITNTQAESLQYEAYRVLKGDVDHVDGEIIFSNIQWGEGVNSANLLTALKSDSTIGSFFAAAATAEDVARVLEGNDFTEDNKNLQILANIVSNHLATRAGVSSEAESPYTITVPQDGYYFVKDTNGLAVLDGRDSKYALINVYNEPAALTIKTGVPSSEKKVLENQQTNYTATATEREKYGEGFNDVADYNIGDTVPFELLSTVPNFRGMKSYYYEFVDQMDQSFTFNDDIVVTVGTRTLAKNTDFSIDFDAATNTFRVILEDLTKICTEAEIGKQIKVTFSARLNEKAEIGMPGNLNKSKLRYGNKPGVTGQPEPGETPWDDVIVFTYEVDVTKTASDNTVKLKDAVFKLYKMVDGNKIYLTVDANQKVTGWENTLEMGSELKSDDSGQFKIIGLDEGTYYLQETKAPTGYNLLKNDVKLEIIATTKNGHAGTDHALTALDYKIDSGSLLHANLDDGIVPVHVVNEKGSVLPETGGIGTPIFYIGGTVLLLGAAVILITRKRSRD